MIAVQPFAESDIPEVADLFRRVLARVPCSLDRLVPYYRAIFFENPSADPRFRSLVHRGAGGRLSGFLGVVPREMLFRGRPIRLAVSTQFMVDPDVRQRMVGVQLLQQFMRGEQDLSIADRAGAVGSRVWEGLGGFSSVLYGMHWIRPLRPLRFASSMLGKRAGLRLLAGAARPFCALADRLATAVPRSHFRMTPPSTLGEPLSIETMLASFPALAGPRSLVPGYTEAGLSWQLKLMAEDPGRGRLERVAVREAGGRLLGWYLYHLSPGGTSEVVQVAWEKGAVNAVLDHLFYHAWKAGSVALRGRMDPHCAQEVSDKHCLFRRQGPLTLIHSRRQDILEAVYRNDAFLSRMEGEWWINFSGMAAD